MPDRRRSRAEEKSLKRTASPASVDVSKTGKGGHPSAINLPINYVTIEYYRVSRGMTEKFERAG